MHFHHVGQRIYFIDDLAIIIFGNHSIDKFIVVVFVIIKGFIDEFLVGWLTVRTCELYWIE